MGCSSYLSGFGATYLEGRTWGGVVGGGGGGGGGGPLARFTNAKIENHGYKKFVFPNHVNEQVRCCF